MCEALHTALLCPIARVSSPQPRAGPRHSPTALRRRDRAPRPRRGLADTPIFRRFSAIWSTRGSGSGLVERYRAWSVRARVIAQMAEPCRQCDDSWPCYERALLSTDVAVARKAALLLARTRGEPQRAGAREALFAALESPAGVPLPMPFSRTIWVWSPTAGWRSRAFFQKAAPIARSGSPLSCMACKASSGPSTCGSTPRICSATGPHSPRIRRHTHPRTRSRCGAGPCRVDVR